MKKLTMFYVAKLLIGIATFSIILMATFRSPSAEVGRDRRSMPDATYGRWYDTNDQWNNSRWWDMKHYPHYRTPTMETTDGRKMNPNPTLSSNTL